MSDPIVPGRNSDFWRDYQPDFWPGPLLGFTAPEPRTLEAVDRRFTPDLDGDPLDVTENGDLLPMTGCEWVTGAEAQHEHDEPNAPTEADPHDIQGFTYCFAVDHRPGEDHVIDRPAD